MDFIPEDSSGIRPGGAELLSAALPLMAGLKTTPLYTALTTAAQLQPSNLRYSPSATPSTREIMAADFASFIFNAKQSVAAIDLAVAIQQELASIAGSTVVASLGGEENVRRILVRGVEAAAALCLPIRMMVPVKTTFQMGPGFNAEDIVAEMLALQSNRPMHRTLEGLRKHGLPLMLVSAAWDLLGVVFYVRILC